MKTDYIETHVHLRWTFQDDKIREWVMDNTEGKVLNACAGEYRLSHSEEIIRNDIDESKIADYHMDVAKLPTEIPAETFDTIIFDPPWSIYQANMRYDGEHVTKGDVEIDTSNLPSELQRDKSQIGHARLAKEGFDYMLKPGGKVIQLAYTGGCMPNRLGYDRLQRVMFDPIGEGKTLIGSVDKKVQTKLIPNE